MVWWIPLLLAGGQAASSASSQKSNQKSMNAAQRRFEKLNFQFANEDLLQTYVALSARRAQDRQVLANSLEEVTLDATRRAGAARVSAGEAGVSGGSTAALINDFKRAQLKSEQGILDTEKYMQEQYGRDVQAARAQATSRIYGGQQQRAPGPNYTQIFLDGITQYMQMSAQMDAANTYKGKKITNENTQQLNPEAGYNPMGIPYQ